MSEIGTNSTAAPPTSSIRHIQDRWSGAVLRPVVESKDAKAPDRRPPTGWTVALGHRQLGPRDSRSLARCAWRGRDTQLVAPRRDDCFQFVCGQQPGRADIDVESERSRRGEGAEDRRQRSRGRSRRDARSSPCHLSQGAWDETTMIGCLTRQCSADQQFRRTNASFHRARPIGTYCAAYETQRPQFETQCNRDSRRSTYIERRGPGNPCCTRAQRRRTGIEPSPPKVPHSKGPTAHLEPEPIGRNTARFLRSVMTKGTPQLGVPSRHLAEADGNRTRQAAFAASTVLKTAGPTRHPDASAGQANAKRRGRCRM